MNDLEIQRIAAAMSCLRPDWPVPSLRTLLERPILANRPRRDVAVALTWVACDPATKTPARVLEAGPWWIAAAGPEERAPRNPKPADACRTCGRTYGPDCCDQPTRRPFRLAADHVTQRAKEARAALRGDHRHTDPEEDPA